MAFLARHLRYKLIVYLKGCLSGSHGPICSSFKLPVKVAWSIPQYLWHRCYQCDHKRACFGLLFFRLGSQCSLSDGQCLILLFYLQSLSSPYLAEFHETMVAFLCIVKLCCILCNGHSHTVNALSVLHHGDRVYMLVDALSGNTSSFWQTVRSYVKHDVVKEGIQ